MEFTLVELGRAFLFSIVLGACEAVLYEPLRFFHKLGFTKPLHFFVCDFLFLIVCAFLTFFFSLVYLEGSLRLFVIAGEIAGFFALSLILRPAADKILDPVIIFSQKFAAKLLKSCRKVMYNVRGLVFNSFERFRTFLRNKVKENARRKKGESGRGSRRACGRRGKASKKKKK